MSKRKVKPGLARLIEGDLIHYSAAADGEATFYEANTLNIHGLIRGPRMLEYVHKRFGRFEGVILCNLVALGHGSIRELAERSLPDLTENVAESGHLLNGGSGHQKSREGSTLEGYHAAVKKLAQYGFIMRLQPHHFRSPTDLQLEAEQTVLMEDFNHSISGSKQQAEMDIKVRRLKRKLRASTRIRQPETHDLDQASKRRKRSESEWVIGNQDVLNGDDGRLYLAVSTCV